MPRKAKTRGALAQRIILFRKARGLTQVELSRAIGLSQRALAHYETVGSKPSPDILIRMAKALGISIDELTGLKKTTPKNPMDRRSLKIAKMLGVLPNSEQKKVSLYIKDLAAKHKTDAP